MKNFKLILGVLTLVFGLVACGGDAGQDQTNGGSDKMETTGGHDHDADSHDGHEGHDHDNDKARNSGQVNTGFSVGHGNGTAYNSNYVCPMHCEGSGSDKPGKCPVCEMDYVAMKVHVKDGHNHNE